MIMKKCVIQWSLSCIVELSFSPIFLSLRSNMRARQSKGGGGQARICCFIVMNVTWRFVARTSNTQSPSQYLTGYLKTGDMDRDVVCCLSRFTQIHSIITLIALHLNFFLVYFQFVWMISLGQVVTCVPLADKPPI